MDIVLEESFQTIAGTTADTSSPKKHTSSSFASSSSTSTTTSSTTPSKRRRRPNASQTGNPTITSHVVVPARRTLFAGRTDGLLIVWRSPNERGVDMKENSYKGHTGGITCVHWSSVLGNEGMLFTGSQDSTIRVWSFGRRDTSDACKQVLRGHGGTVLDLDFSGKYLVSVSNDRTLRIWRATPGRQILLYPWFETLQIISSIGSDINFTSVGVRAAETTHIYVGDSSGDLHIVDQSSSSSNRSSTGNNSNDEKLFQLNKKWRHDQPPPHSLGITHVKVVPSQNFLITLSYDCTLRVYDAMSAKPFLTEENPHRCRFTGMDWNETHQELIVIDSGGWVYIWNIYMEKCVKEYQLRTKIAPPGYGHSSISGKHRSAAALSSVPMLTSISVRPEHQTFIVAGGNKVEQWHISRELSFKEHKGHTGPIVSIMSIPTASNGGGAHMYEMAGNGGDEGGEEEGKVATRNEAGHGGDPQDDHGDSVLYSASLDNTIRSWDPYDMACVSTMEETSSEISCMTYIPLAGLLVTGSDDGAVRFWNPASGSTIMLKNHTNTVSCMTMCHLQRNHFLITGGYDGKVGFWDVTKRTRSVKPRIENIFQAHHGRDISFGGPGSVSHTVDEEILCIVYHEVDPDEQKRVFLTGGNDSIIRIWNVFSYQLESTLQGHEDSVTCMALDANFLFSGSDDKTIRVWNLVHVDEPYQLSVIQHAHLKPIQDILILEDTGHLVSCSFDGKIRVWDWGHEDDQSGEGFGDGVVGEGGNVVEGSEGGQKTHTGSAAKHETKEDDDKEDHGGHSVLHEFVHPSQFRCLGYYPNQGDILVGTEESNILTFSLPSSVTGKGGPRPTSATGKYAGVPEEKEEVGLVGGEEKFESKYDENMDDEGGERRTGLLSEQ